MSSGHVSEIVNQPLMPNRPEEFDRELCAPKTSSEYDAVMESPKLAG
jgi:hypothetical protein